MNLGNVNIGSYPGAGDGDPLRAAFNVINQNFGTIANVINNPSTNTVTMVAGRQGNVTLTINDIAGFSGLGLIPNPPTASNSSGVLGQVAVDSTSLYLCIGTNTWVKTSVISSF